MNKWMDFTNEYSQFIKGNFEVMNKFWKASMGQNDEYTKKNMEIFFDHMNRNVEFMQDLWASTVSTNDELKQAFRSNIENFNNRYQKIYEESVKAFTPKAKTAE